MTKTTILLAFGLAQALGAQQLQIDAFEKNGQLTFSDPGNDGETYTVQWSPDLSADSWRSNWDALTSIQLDSNKSAAVVVPMFYRVIQETVDLGEYGYPYGSVPLTWVSSLGEWLTFVDTRVEEENVPVYVTYPEPDGEKFLGNANKHYFRFTTNDEIWYDYIGIDADHLYFFGYDEVGREVRADPPIELPRRVAVGKEYVATSPWIENGSAMGTVSFGFKVLRRTSVFVIGGAFDDVIELRETLELPNDEPKTRRLFCARGIGLVKRVEIEGGDQHRELFRIDSD